MTSDDIKCCLEEKKGVFTMLELLKKEANITYTENGAVTNRSSKNFCLDFF